MCLLILAICIISLLFKKSKLFFWVWHTNQRTSLLDNNKPTPFSHCHVFSVLPLANNKKLPLISPLCKVSESDQLPALPLHISDEFIYNNISVLLKLTKCTSSKENKSMS